MSDNKPLIFVHPFSDTLKQLKDVIEENAQNDEIEVFEVESLGEMAQLLPTIGPSVTIISNPRKCAMLLQANRKIVTRMKSKVILLSPKVIPRRTLEKFMKIALTDCITEPVAPKTLLYKVKLMLRSLPTGKEEDDQDVVISADEDENIKNGEAQHVEKGVKLDGHLKGKIKDDTELSLKLIDEDEEGVRTTSESERKSDLLRGDITPDLDIEAENEEETLQKNDYDGPIDGFYRGEVKASLSLADDPDEDETNESDLEDDDLLAQAKAELSLDLADEPDIYQESPEEESKDKDEDGASPLLTLDMEEEEEKSATAENHNKLDGHLRGKVDTNGLELEDESEIEERAVKEEDKKKSPFDDLPPSLDLDDDEMEMTLEKEDPNKGSVNNKVNPTLEMEEEDEKEDRQDSTDQLAGNLGGEGSAADKLDKYYKGELEDGLKLEDEEEDSVFDAEKEKERFKEKNKNSSLDLDDDFSVKELKKEEDDTIPTLEIEEDLVLEENELDHEKMIATQKKKKAEQDPNLNLELEEFKKQKKEKAEAANKNAQGMLQRKDLSLEDEEDDESSNESKQKGQINQKKSNAKLDLEIEDEKGNKIKNHGVDHIQKYYGVKNLDSLEKGADWNGLNKKEERLDYPDAEKPAGERELIIPKIDRGEQTIDYSKLKNDFDISISTDRDRKVITGEYDFGRNQENEEAQGEKLDLPEADLFDEPLTEEEQEIIQSKEIVYEPDSKGIEYVIKMATTYLDPKKDFYTILYQAGNNIYKETKGVTTFFIYNPQSEIFKEEYTGHLFIDTGVPKDLRESKWINLKKDKLEDWKITKLPTWQDHTFQESENEFIYPFYLSVHHMGFAIVSFSSELKEEESHKIEIILESARGGYLNHYNAIMRSIEGDREKEAKTKKVEKKGFLKGMFNKKAS